MKSPLMKRTEDSSNSSNSSNSKNDYFPPYLFESQPEQLAGCASTKKNIFWLRCIASLLAFSSFVIMSTVPNINIANPEGSDLFLPGCMQLNVGGTFDYRPYQLSIAAGSLVFIHSFLFTIYYLLPIDPGTGHKYVPGIDEIFQQCINPDDTRLTVNRVASFCKTHSKFIELFIDATLLTFLLIVVLIASIILERGQRFEFPTSPSTVWYTVGTWYKTFSHTSPQCVPDEDPAQKIRASLAMLYLTALVLVFTLQVSYKSFREVCVLCSLFVVLDVLISACLYFY